MGAGGGVLFSSFFFLKQFAPTQLKARVGLASWLLGSFAGWLARAVPSQQVAGCTFHSLLVQLDLVNLIPSFGLPG